MIKPYILSALLIFCVVIISCGQKAEFTSAGANSFGAKISDQEAVELGQLDFDESLNDTLNVTVKATIEEVCQAKGCWMTLNDEKKEVFVKFKDYAFFVPLDAGGKDAVVRGKIYSEVTSVDELRHYAEDKGASSEEIASITEPKRELRMMADGVIIYNN